MKRRPVDRLSWALLLACLWRGAGAAAPVPLPDWLVQQEQHSWQHMLENISPREPKRPGEPPPLPGIVVGALQKKDPDYYFHWIRDSSLVMHAAADAFALRRPYASRSLFERQFTDFLTLTQRLQALPSKYGLGEPRYTVTGELDSLPWSRPQFDGPALRVLAVVDFLRAAEAAQLARPDLEALATTVLGADLDFVASVWNQRGFDAWEELVADSYHTRLVQLAALEQGADWLERHGAPAERVAKYRNVAQRLEPLLDDHWDPTRGFLRSQLAIVATDGYTAKKTDLDAEVIVAVVDADRNSAAHSVLDDRVQASVAVFEELFRSSYPINHRSDVGLGYGRYAGDVYYGGNPWVFITADFARFYYRLAARLEAGASLAVTARNAAFLRSAMPGTNLSPGSALNREAMAAFTRKADRIMMRLQLSTPADGQMYEQIDKRTGRPASSRGIGWSHAAFLEAVYERARLAPETAARSAVPR
ncbi:MAG TPA: glycoside hydrolase family 15 protein [Steroidobacteraceae bacterium]|nr:glycoside hydrolase family 15 protein [Steroidobacteraceae bacterium]